MRKRIIIFSLAVFMVYGSAMLMRFFLAQEAQAQENQVGGQSVETEAVAVATVNIYNAKIVSQNESDVKVSFDISNRTGIQPQVRYAVQLAKKEGSGLIVADEKVYQETLELGENETISKEIEYVPPRYLEGEFQIWLKVGNESGLLLALVNVGEVNLKGSGQFIEIVNSSCWLKVEGEEGDKRYTLDQGVDIATSEKLIGTCELVNYYNRTVSFIPKLETHWRTTFGKAVEDNGELQPALSLEKGERKSFYFVLPRAKFPQAYDVILMLSENDQIISNAAVFHYVLRGVSATIQNLRPDKDYYSSGEVAKISFTWTAAADSFPDSRLGPSQPEKALVEATMKNSSGVFCADPAKREIAEDDQVNAVLLEMPINLNCIDPQITVSLKDGNGNILDEKVFQVSSKNVPNGENPENKGKDDKEQKAAAVPAKKSVSAKFLLYIASAVLVIIVIIIVFLKKRKNGGVANLLIFLAAGSLLLVAGNHARADVFYAPPTLGEYKGLVSFTVSLDKNTYAPGEKITAVGSAYYPSCFNRGRRATLSVQINNKRSVIFSERAVGYNILNPSGTVSVSAPAAPGTHQAVFTGNMVKYSIPYTVSNQIPTATINNPSGNRTVNLGNRIDFSGTGTDPDGTITAYEWRENNCSTGTQLSNSQTFSKSNFPVGSHTIFLRVRDNSNAWSTNCPSRIITVNTAPTPPAAPSGLSATQSSCSQINLSWSDNSNNETGFKIERKIGAIGAWSQITIVGTNIISYQNIGLAQSTNYYYRVRAYNAAGNSGYSNEVNATTLAQTFSYTCTPSPNCSANCGSSYTNVCNQSDSCTGNTTTVANSFCGASCPSGTQACSACPAPPYTEVSP